MKLFFYLFLFAGLFFPKEAWVSGTVDYEIKIEELVSDSNYIFVVGPVTNMPKFNETKVSGRQYLYTITEILRLPKTSHEVEDSFFTQISKYLGLTKPVTKIEVGAIIAVTDPLGFEEVEGKWSYTPSSKSILDPLISENRIVLLKSYNSEDNFFTSVLESGIVSMDTKELIKQNRSEMIG